MLTPPASACLAFKFILGVQGIIGGSCWCLLSDASAFLPICQWFVRVITKCLGQLGSSLLWISGLPCPGASS
eukprot:3285769-Amphidinium_carterae.2